jgi:ATP-dependent Clp protease ATP-binding subunit ClpC
VVERSEHVRRVLDLAWEEAALLGHCYLGPEHVVLGVLRDGGSGAAEVLRARGVDLQAAREATRARRGGVARVPRTPLREPPVLATRAPQLAHEHATALGHGEVGAELLLGVVKDLQTRRPRCMSNRWARQLHASVGLPGGYRGAAGPLLAALGVDLDELRDAVSAELLKAPR